MVADTTYVPTWARWLSLVIVLDACCIGWARKGFPELAR
jgi:hypothetical protein